MKIETHFSTAMAIIGFALLQLVSSNVQAADKDKYDLQVNFPKGSQHRVDMQFEHKGKVIVDGAGQQEDYRTLPMNTVAKLGYYQRYTGNPKDNQAVRFYDKSKGEFRISKGIASAELGERNRLVVARVKSVAGKRIQMASALSTLDQAELELLKNPVDPLSLATLLNKKGVVVEEKWTPDEEGLANFLSVDRILQNDVKMYIKDIKSGVARVFIIGKLRAAVDDVTTEMEVTSIVKVVLEKNMISSVRLGIREVRQPGQVAPGFDGRTTVDLKVVADSSCKHLTNESLAKYTKSRVIEQRLKWDSPMGRFQLKYDPRWRMITAEQEAAILRYLSNGTLLAQCNVVQLPSRPASKPLSMKEYQTEIAKIAAADPNAKLVSADKFKTKENASAYRVEVTGIEEGVPVTWLYYHVASTDGRRVTFVFTLQDEVQGIFQPADRALVDSLKFFPKATKATQPKRSAKSGNKTNSTRR